LKSLIVKVPQDSGRGIAQTRLGT